MTETLQSWNAALHRVLDVLAASAQPVVTSSQNPYYRWGQHIHDDLGDNTGQYGLHGTSEAVRALAAGVKKLGRKSRYTRFLAGGVLTLRSWIESPKKEIDLLKTVKIGEWLGALADGDESTDHISELSAKLISGQWIETGSWDWNAQKPSESTLLPTLYALDGLVRANRRLGTFGDEIKAGIVFSLHEIEKQKVNGTDYEELYAWQSCLYKLCEIVSIYEQTNGLIAAFRDQLERLLYADAAFLHPDLKEFKRFEYRIQTATSEEHAYCVMPVGLMQIGAELWAQSAGLNIALEGRDLEGRVANFFRLIYSPSGFPFQIVGSCAYAARLLSESGVAIDDYLTRFSQTLEEEQVAPLTVEPTTLPDPFSVKAARKALYLQLLKTEDLTDVEILQSLLGGYSGAHLDLCEITLSTGAPELLQVLKLDEARNAEQEKSGVETAEKLIDSKYRVHLIGYYPVPDSDRGVLRFEYAGTTLAPGRIQSFLSFLDAESSTEEVVKAIESIYQKALKRVLSSTLAKHTSLGKIREYFEQVRNKTFWTGVENGFSRLQRAGKIDRAKEYNRLLLHFPFKTVSDPFVESPERNDIWEQPFQGAIVGYAHGDLNPRNVLMVREDDEDYYVPVLIDFHRFKAWAPSAVDFARLEAGIQIKGLRSYIGEAALRETQHEHLIRYEKWINSSADWIDSIPLGLPAELRKAATFVKTIRENYFSRVPIDKQDRRAYFAVLMFNYFSYLRPIYDRVLTTEQKLFSFYSAASIFKRHFLYPSK